MSSNSKENKEKGERMREICKRSEYKERGRGNHPPPPPQKKNAWQIIGADMDTHSSTSLFSFFFVFEWFPIA